jgi:four helix bundle protein
MPPLSLKTQREWKNPEGYRELAAWSNARLLEILIRKYTSTLVPTLKHAHNLAPKSPLTPHEYRLKAQLDDCARSTVANIEEGFKRPTTKEYLDFLGFSQASLEEVKGDVNRSLHNHLIKSIPHSSLSNLGIDLKDWNDWCKDGKNEVRLLDYGHLREIKGEDLTYEIFMELINKTDFLLRQLVKSLQTTGDEKQENRKDPRAMQEQQNDEWLKDYMEKLKENSGT